MSLTKPDPVISASPRFAHFIRVPTAKEKQQRAAVGAHGIPGADTDPARNGWGAPPPPAALGGSDGWGGGGWGEPAALPPAAGKPARKVLGETVARRSPQH